MTESIPSETLRPGEVGYDQARTVWNAMVDRHPAVIVRCRQVSDVVAGVALARRDGLESESGAAVTASRVTPCPRAG